MRVKLLGAWAAKKLQFHRLLSNREGWRVKDYRTGDAGKEVVPGRGVTDRNIGEETRDGKLTSGTKTEGREVSRCSR